MARASPAKIGFNRGVVIHAFDFKAEQAPEFALETREIGERAEIFRSDLRPERHDFVLHLGAQLAIVQANSPGSVKRRGRV